MSTRQINLLIIGLICWIFTGCATTQRLYQGPQLPNDKVARIIDESGNCILMHSINGIKGARCFRAPFASTAKVEILPGDHTLNISCQIMRFGGNVYSSINNLDIKFKAEPGQTYFLESKYDLTQLTWSFIIKNEESKEVIVEEGPYPLRFQGNPFRESALSDQRRREIDQAVEDTLRIMSPKPSRRK